MATFSAFGLQSSGLRPELVSDKNYKFFCNVVSLQPTKTFANAAFGGIGDLFGLRPSKLRPSAGADQ